MKKGEIFELEIKGINFSGEGFGEFQGEKFFVKGGIPFEKLKVKFIKKKSEKNICKILEKICESPISINPICSKFGECGGCTYLNLSYDNQIKFKEESLLEIFKNQNLEWEKFLGIIKAPHQFEYRNKMEFSFGDEFKGGQLELGLHKKGNPFSIVPTYDCHLVSEDFRKITKFTVQYFREQGLEPYKLKTHKGYLRNLILRSGKNELMVCLVTSSHQKFNLEDFKNKILELKLQKNIGSLLHLVSDSLSDAVIPSEINLLHGNDYIYEEIFGLKFKINLFSFFQTNTEGMKLLYEKVRNSVGDVSGTILDLYCGIGTIGQVLSNRIKNKVIGIEIVKEAVEMAKENAILNNLDCEFIEGDVVEVIEKIQKNISTIIIDPPRAGITKKGVNKICKFNVENIIYVSCNPKTLVEDLKIFVDNGYKIKTVQGVDMFPGTYHMETICFLKKLNRN